MKSNIHPTYFADAQIICACGNVITAGGTHQKIHIELCSKCHPFYTGAQKFVDSANRIDKFQKKQDIASKYKATVVKKKEEEKQKSSGPKSLAEMLAALQ
ncbi:MAG TPA: 50S ribosomal protein L31 [Patescibacteria group bacterium]|nr:50S ribosomal protein L31 [Patescibacteria group bacterium]